MTAPVRKSVFGVAAAVLVAKGLGFLREVVIAGHYGTSADYDLYLVAIILPSLFYGVLNYASFYLLVPHFTELTAKLDRNEAGFWRAVWIITNSNLVVAALATAAILLAAPWLMRIWSSGLDSEQFATVVFYCRLVSLIVLLGTTEAFLRAMLNVRRAYVYPAASFILFNLVAIASILFLHESLGIGAVAVGLLVGLLTQDLYLLMGLLRLRPFRGFTLASFDSDARAVMATGAVLVAIEVVQRSFFMIDRYYAPGFGEGVVSALAYAQVLVVLPDAVIGYAIGTVLFPMFSRSIARHDDPRFRGLYSRAVLATVLAAVPIVVGVLLGSSEIVQLAFRRGAFDAESVAVTAGILRPLAPSLAALFIISTSVRACYAQGRHAAILTLAGLMLAAKFVGTHILTDLVGYAGIPLATSVAQVGFALAAALLIVIRTPGKEGNRILGRAVLLIPIGAATWFGVREVLPLMGDLADPGGSQLAAAIRLALVAGLTAVVYGVLLWTCGYRRVIEKLSISRRLGDDQSADPGQDRSAGGIS